MCNSCNRADCPNATFDASHDNTIEYLNATNVINGFYEEWNILQLHKDIQARTLALVSPVDVNEIVILGGRRRETNLGDVLIFNT